MNNISCYHRAIRRFISCAVSMFMVVTLILVMTVPVQAKGKKASSKKPAITSVKGKLILNKGKTYKIKAKVKNVKGKKNRALGYQTSNKKIATVSKKGIIKAKKKGKVTIKVYLKKKKSVCKKIKVTVTNKKSTAETTEETTEGGNTNVPDATTQEPACAIASLKCLDETLVEIAFNKAVALEKSDFTLQKKETQAGSYRKELDIKSVNTQDRVSYVLELKSTSLDKLRIGEWIKLMVQTPEGMLTGETCYSSQVTHATAQENGNRNVINSFYKVFTGSVGYFLEREREECEWYYAYGKVKMSAYNLPDGVSAKLQVKKDSSIASSNNYSLVSVNISGIPETYGVWKSQIVYEDELGNTMTFPLAFVIGDAEHIEALSCDVSILKANGLYKEHHYTSPATVSLYVAGGGESLYYECEWLNKPDTWDSGPFDFKEVEENRNVLKIDRKDITAGLHTIQIKISDSPDDAHFVMQTINVNVVESARVDISLQDGKARKLDGNEASIQFYSEERISPSMGVFNQYTPYYYDEGYFQHEVFPGSYRIEIRVGSYYLAVPHQFISGDCTINRQLPIYRVIMDDKVVTPTGAYQTVGDNELPGDSAYRYTYAANGEFLQSGTCTDMFYPDFSYQISAVVNNDDVEAVCETKPGEPLDILPDGKLEADKIPISVNPNKVPLICIFTAPESGTYYLDAVPTDKYGAPYATFWVYRNQDDKLVYVAHNYITSNDEPIAFTAEKGEKFIVGISYSFRNDENIDIRVSSTNPLEDADTNLEQ